MSKHETWRTRQYWESVGGLLIEEFVAIPANRSAGIARRSIDGVIVLGAEKRIQVGGSYDLKGRDLIIVQTKSTRLGMYLMGQALFSKEIMTRFQPRSVRSVAICGRGDAEMEKLCERHNIEIVIIDEQSRRS